MHRPKELETRQTLILPPPSPPPPPQFLRRNLLLLPQALSSAAAEVLVTGHQRRRPPDMTDTVVSSFWGPVTSGKELCEENYAHSSYIAEFYNTISNIPCIILAFIGLIIAIHQRFEKRFSVLHISNMILAIGSMVFHATLQNVLQQSDETPMVWEMLLYLYVLYLPDWHYRSTMPTFLFMYGTAFAVIHSLVRFGIGFKVHYVGLCLLCIPRMYKYYIQTKEVAAKRLAKLYVTTLILGTICWLFDRAFCQKLTHWYINPQGHAWWHVLMGFNSYFANTFLMFCRAQQRGWEPRVNHIFGVFPYVKIQKPKKQVRKKRLNLLSNSRNTCSCTIKKVFS